MMNSNLELSAYLRESAVAQCVGIKRQIEANAAFKCGIAKVFRDRSRGKRGQKPLNANAAGGIGANLTAAPHGVQR